MLVLIEKQKDNQVVEYPLDLSITISAEPGAVYMIKDTETGDPPKNLVLKKKGETLEVEVDGKTVAQVEAFFVAESETLFSADGSDAPPDDMAVAGDLAVPEDVDSGVLVVWDAGDPGMSAGWIAGLAAAGGIGLAAAAASGGGGGGGAATDTTAPTVTITDDTPGTATGDVTYTFTFSESVTGFTPDDVDVTGGIKGNFTVVSDTVYTLVVTPNADSTTDITVDVAAGIAVDAAGNGNTAATQSVQAVDTIPPDTTAPTVTITDNTPGTATGDVTYTFTFSESVTGFTVDDVQVAGGAKGDFTMVSDTVYTLVVTPDDDSTADITVDVAAGVAVDAAGDGNTAATQSVQPVATIPPDTTAPAVTITDDTPGTATGDVTYTFTFSESVTGFTTDDVEVAGGVKGDFTAISGTVYTLVVTPDDDSTADITVDVAAGVAVDAAGNGNTAANQSVQPVDTTSPDTPDMPDTPDNPGTPGTDSSYMITLNAAAGTFSSTLRVQLYDQSGDLIGETDHDFSTGSFFYKITNGYTGVVFAKVSDLNAVDDYTDETSGTQMNLGTSLRAMARTDGQSNVNITVTPLTELAVQLAGIDESNLDLTSDDLDFNEMVGDLFGVDHITGSVTTVTDDNYDNSDGLNSAEQYGNVLAMLSGVDQTTGSIAETISQILSTIVQIQDTEGCALGLTQDGVELLQLGIDNYTAGATGNTAGLCDLLLQPPVIEAAGGGGITAQERDAGVVVALSGVSAGDTVIVNWGGQTCQETITAAHINSDNQAEVTIPSSVIAAAGNSETLAVTYSVNGGNQSPAVIINVDAQVPAAPTFTLAEDTGSSGNDGVTNNAAINIAGLLENATWEYSIDGGQTWTTGTDTSFELAQGQYPANEIQVRQTDGNGATSLAQTNAATITVDTTVPTVTITDDTDGTATGDVTYTFTFSESVTGFTADDVEVAGGAKGDFTMVSDTVYTLVVTPDDDSTADITVDVAAGVAVDAAGNGNTAATQSVQPVDTIPPDTTAPAVTITDDTPGTATGYVTYTFTFSESVTGFTADDVDVSGGVKGDFTAVSGTVYTLVVTPDDDSTADITVDVAAGVAVDAAGNGNTAANQSIQPVDTISPDTPDTPDTADNPGTPGTDSSYMITLNAAAGTFSSTLRVQLYDQNGNLIVETDHDFSTGSFSYQITNGYTGIVFAKVSDLNEVDDYMDETTGTLTNLGTTLRAMTRTDGHSNVSLTVSPLTELAVQLAGIDQDNLNLTEDDLAYNEKVGDLFDVDDITGPVTTVTEENYDSSDGLDASEKYGNVLAMLSGLDEDTGSVEETIEQIKSSIVEIQNSEDTELGLTQDGVELLQQGIDNYTSGETGNTANLSDLLLQPPVIDAAGGGGITAQEKDAGVVVALSDVNEGDRVTVYWGGLTYQETITAAHINTENQAEITIPSSVIEAAGDAETLAVTYSVNGGDKSPAVVITVDTQVPEIQSVSIPDTAMSVGDTVTVTITVDSDTDTCTTINGTISGFALSNLTKVSDTGYTAQFTITDGGTDVADTTDIPVDITITDTAGNASTAYTRAISQDNDAIDANRPTLDSVTPGDDATDVAVDANLTLTFSEAVYQGSTGNLIIKLTSDDSAFKVISITDSRITGWGTTTLTVNLNDSFAEDTGYYVVFDDNSILDANGSPAAPITDKTAWNFATPDNTPPTVTTSDDTAGTATGDVTYTFTFSEAVTGFTADDIDVTGGAKGDFTAVSDTVYTLVVTPSADSTTDITVDVAANVATDAAGNGNTAAVQSVQAVDTTVPDTTAPTVAITDDTAGTATGDVTYTFTFSEAVTGFTADDIDVTGGAKGDFTAVSDTVYTLVVTPSADSTTDITVDVGANVATDAAGNGNTAAVQSVQAVDTTVPDTTAPTVAITDDTAGTATGDVTYTFTFSEAVTGFTADDIDVTGGAKGDFTAVSDTVYTLVVTPSADSTTDITVDVGANVATDAAGNGNTAAVQSVQAVDTTVPDTTAPTVAITDDTAGTATGDVTYTFTFSEAVTGFTADDIDVTGGAKGDFTAVSDTVYTLVVTPSADSTTDITVDVGANVATDAAGNGNTAAVQSVQAVDTTVPDTTAPTVAITDDTAGTATGDVTYTFTFSEAVTGFTADDIDVTGGAKGDFTAVSDTVYTLVVTPSADSTTDITVDVGANVATDAAGNGNTAAVQSVQAVDTTVPDTTAPTVAITDDTAGTATGDVTYTFTFSEAVTGFTADDIDVTGGAKGDFTAVSDTVYTLVVTPSADSTTDITVDVVAGVAIDGAGNSNTAATPSVQAVDTQVPAVPLFSLATDTGSSGTDNITNDGTINVTLAADAATWEYSINGGSWETGTGTGTEASFELAEGTYGSNAIQVRQTDAAGNTSEAAANAGAITVDTTAPAPSFDLATDTGSSGTDNITNDGTINVTLADDAATWEYSINGGSWETGTGTGTEASFELAEGTYGTNAIQVRQTDAAGNTSEADANAGAITVDTTAPAPSFDLVQDTGSSGTDNITNDGTINVTLANDAATWEYSINGGSWETGTGTGTEASFELPEGTYGSNAVQVRQTDAAGNTSEAAANAGAITVDTTAPSAPSFDLATDTGSSGTDNITNDGTINVTLAADAATWEYSTNGGSSWETGTGTGTDAGFELTDGTYGTNAVQVRQADTAGNTSTETNSDTITVDTTAPTIASLTVSGDDTINSSDTLTEVAFSGTTTGVENDQTITVEIGGESTNVTVTNNTFSGSIDLSSVSDGSSVAVTADVSDAAGNSADQFTNTIVKDTVAPVITGPSGEAGDTSSAVSITEGNTLVYDFSDDDSATWSLSGGDDQAKFSIDTATGELTFNSAPDYDNPTDNGVNNVYDVQVTATDANGNSSSQDVAVTVNEAASAASAIVVFDLTTGNSSDHSEQAFQAGTEYTIYIKVDSRIGEGEEVTIDLTLNEGERWSGAGNLDSDDTVILVGDGSNVVGQWGGSVATTFINTSSNCISWKTTSGAWCAALYISGKFTRAASQQTFSTVYLWNGSWAALPDLTAENFSNMSTMPAGIMTSQGLA